jgi:hypothetical protein
MAARCIFAHATDACAYHQQLSDAGIAAGSIRTVAQAPARVRRAIPAITDLAPDFFAPLDGRARSRSSP